MTESDAHSIKAVLRPKARMTEEVYEPRMGKKKLKEQEDSQTLTRWAGVRQPGHLQPLLSGY
jgi:hypothetical protein